MLKETDQFLTSIKPLRSCCPHYYSHNAEQTHSVDPFSKKAPHWHKRTGFYDKELFVQQVVAFSQFPQQAHNTAVKDGMFNGLLNHNSKCPWAKLPASLCTFFWWGPLATSVIIEAFQLRCPRANRVKLLFCKAERINWTIFCSPPPLM